MKKSLLGLLLAVALVVPAFAANWFVGGEIGYMQKKAYENLTDATVKEFTVTPEIGYNLSEKWDLGLDFGIAYKDSELKDAKGVSREYKVYPFVRYNVFSIGDFSILAKCIVGFSSGKTEGEVTDADRNFVSRDYSVGVAPVVTYKINDSWSLIATLDFLTLGYNHNEKQMKDGSVEKGDEVGFYLNDGKIAQIGFQYHF